MNDNGFSDRVPRDLRVKVDSFFVETRIHSCTSKECKFNMFSLAPNNGLHCQLKKISIDEHGKCKFYGLQEGLPRD